MTGNQIYEQMYKKMYLLEKKLGRHLNIIEYFSNWHTQEGADEIIRKDNEAKTKRHS